MSTGLNLINCFMKKRCLIGMAVVSTFAQAQLLVDDFENTTNTWNNVSCYTDIRENEYKTGLNTSDKVLYTTRNVGCDNWSGAIYTPESSISGYNYLHVMMYRNNENSPNLKVADTHPTGGQVDLTPMNEITAGAWQDVVFDISDFCESGIDFIMLMVDRTESLSEQAWMLCDNILLNNDATPRTETTDGTDTGSNTDETGTGETDGYQLVWADYFDGSSLDTENWNIEVNGDGGGNSELQYYRAENVSVGTEPVSGKSCLILTAKKESYNGKSATSGRITTQGKVYFTHGKIEASIKFPRTANGLWPAFWMMGNDITQSSWPSCGEIDIVEMGHADGITNGTQDRYFNGACHWGYYDASYSYPNYAQHATNTYGMQDDFHLFTLYWDENALKMYLDQDKYPTVAPYFEMAIDSKDGDWAAGNYFHKPFFLLFNLAVGGSFPQIWNISDVTALDSGEACMYVDYVKVYQLGNNDETFEGPANTTASATATRTETIRCYPNPSRDLFAFGRTVQSLEVFNLTGAIVYSARNVSAIDAGNWPKGTYIARIIENNNIFHLKMIKD